MLREENKGGRKRKRQVKTVKGKEETKCIGRDEKSWKDRRFERERETERIGGRERKI